MRERVEAMKAIWTKSKPEYDGEFVKFPPMMTWPNTTVSEKLGTSWGTLAASAYAQSRDRARRAVSRVC